MPVGVKASWLLAQEARGMLTRLARVQPFALHETMVPAAGVSIAAQAAIEGFLGVGRRHLRGRVQRYLRWLVTGEGRKASPAEAQRQFTLLRLMFNNVLTQFDVFADVMTQRSERQNGVWLAGLDVLAEDALSLPGYYDAPPVVCHLERGHGAAIRRARTRLPGGGDNPVAVVRVPRERLVGSGVGSSLVHEVGHQGATLLDLLVSLRPVLKGLQGGTGRDRFAWILWERWLSEVLADFWSVAKLGVSATLGLIAVVSIPRPFVFRMELEDPHPIPWIRVKLSCAMGAALYPHPHWEAVRRVWESFYPLDGLDPRTRSLLGLLESSMPGYVSLIVNHRPPSLFGASLGEAIGCETRQPARLHALFDEWTARPDDIGAAPPALVVAALGQARAHGRLTPEREAQMLASLLTHWALRRAIEPCRCREVRRPA